MKTPLVSLDQDALSKMMPMYISLDSIGRITGVGPTLAKLLPNPLPIGEGVFDHFVLRRPTGVESIAELRAKAGQRIQLIPKRGGAALRGLAVPTQDGGLVVNLSFGIGLIDAVRSHALTDADFAPTDLAIEMLYLVEVKTAVMQELRRLNKRLQGAKSAAEEQALTDTLTGLRNRRALEIRLQDLVQNGIPFGLMHIDLDFFKQVNDSLGHAAGDAVLRNVAEVLTLETRTTDLVARVGGDEFVVVLPGMADRSVLTQIGTRIIERLGNPTDFQGNPCRISASIGLTVSSTYRLPDADQMLADADSALYASKRGGRSQVQFYQPQLGDKEKV